jgi:uroporphyrinogen-III decarboxylase
MTKLTSRERMLRALNHEPADHIPCAFMSFSALRRRLNEDRYEQALAEVKLGLDSMVFIPTASRPARIDHPDLRGLPVRFHPEVTVKEWRDPQPLGQGPGGELPGDFPILHKEYRTPAGSLATAVQLSDDWPHGEHIPFIDDYQIPRALKPLVTEPQDLEALRFLLMPPNEDDISQYLQEAEVAQAFAREHGLLLTGGWGVGMDMANWLCGMEQTMLLSLEQPGFVGELLEMIHTWNKARMEIVLRAPLDLYIRRAWYEGCDFVVPDFYRQAVLPRLKSEVDLAHERGAKFGYICSSGTQPRLDDYLEAGFDVLLGVDPIQGTYTDMPLMKQRLGGHVALWGGVSGAVTVELGTEADVRAAVRGAIQTLGPHGFILSPVDNITVDEPLTWRNLEIFVDEWRRGRGDVER